MHTKTLWIKDEYLQAILSGNKTIEVRAGYSNLRALEPGDLLLLNGVYPFVIGRIARYRDFRQLLEHEAASAIAPGLTVDALRSALESIYPPEKQALGLIAFEIAPPGKDAHDAG